LLQDAAKDLLTLLSIDKNNREASKLLQAIRVEHTMNKGSPISNTLDDLANNLENACKVLLGLLTNDLSCAMELGRLDGMKKLWNLHSALALQVIACACSHIPFVPTFADSQISQRKLADIADNREGSLDYKMPALSVWLRFVLYLDSFDTTSESQVDGIGLVRTCRAALQSQDPRLIQAALEILSSWTIVDNEAPNKSKEEIRAICF
jgi:hypothetical protein